jgi:uncharacterized membrane protein
LSTGRLEAFSDGVIAVAITLLALGLMVPVPDGRHGLAHELALQWPAYLAYVISFATIGIIWINHHAAIGRLREADHAILVINLLLLMSICVLPFTTRLMAEYLTHNGGERLAAAVYSGSLLVMGICFLLLNWHMLFAKTHLLEGEFSEAQRRRVLRRNAFGVIPYVLALALAAISPYLSIALCGLVAAFYALPTASSI